MLTFLTRWMQDFQIDGIRMDSVENVANWDFIRDFKDAAREQFKQRYPAEGRPRTPSSWSSAKSWRCRPSC